MESYTLAQMERGAGQYCVGNPKSSHCRVVRTGATKAFTYDGRIWHTCQINDGIRGNPVEVVYIPEMADAAAAWKNRA